MFVSIPLVKEKYEYKSVIMEYKYKGEIINFIRQKDYVWEKYLDEGGFGKTALIQDPVINEHFVCKKYEPQPHIDKMEYYENFKNEIKIMHKLFHNNIVRIFNYYLYPSKNTGFILMDYIDGEKIDDFLIWSPEEINNIFSQAIDAFSYLEKFNILHRDIRPKNILVTKEKVVKIIDFGFGKQALSPNDFDKSISLSWLYETPEDFNQSIYDFKTEIYFVGKLFETIIRDYNISGFKYNDLLKKMIIKSHNERIDSFEQIKELIQNNSYIFDEYFNYSEKQQFQNFMDKVTPIFGEINTNANYFNSIEQLVIELEDVFKNNYLDKDVQNIVDIARAFVKGNYTYYSNKKVDVDSLKLFIQLIKTSNTEKKNIIKLGIVNRLRGIKRIEKQEDTFTDEDIPF
jgi:serine/threonine-protein kinase